LFTNTLLQLEIRDDATLSLRLAYQLHSPTGKPRRYCFDDI
jgi:hypothetical protein